MHKPTLTIYVMAYENGDLVRGILSTILPFGCSEVIVIVADNSDKTDGVLAAVADLAPHFHGRLIHRRYKANIGQQGTILRAFETAASPYLWIVGAGNFFLPKCLETLLPILNSRRPDVLLHFENNLWRRTVVMEERKYSSAIDLVRDHSHSVACSINSMIYSTAAMLPLLRVGYETASSLAPHTGMVFEGMRTGALQVTYLPLAIIHRPQRQRIHWTMSQFLKGLPCVFPATCPQIEADAFMAELQRTDEWMLWEAENSTASPS